MKNIPLILSKTVKEHKSIYVAYSGWQKYMSRHSRIRFLKHEIERNVKLCEYFATYYPKQVSKMGDFQILRIPTNVLYTQKFANYMLYNHPEIYFYWQGLDLMYLTYTNDVEEALYAAIAFKKMVGE